MSSGNSVPPLVVYTTILVCNSRENTHWNERCIENETCMQNISDYRGQLYIRMNILPEYVSVGTVVHNIHYTVRVYM